MRIPPPPGTTAKLPTRPATLNRHKRGRPRFMFLKKLGLRLYRRALPVVVIVVLIGGGLYALDHFGVI